MERAMRLCMHAEPTAGQTPSSRSSGARNLTAGMLAHAASQAEAERQKLAKAPNSAGGMPQTLQNLLHFSQFAPQAEAERQKLAKVPGMLNPYENNDDMNNSD